MPTVDLTQAEFNKLPRKTRERLLSESAERAVSDRLYVPAKKKLLIVYKILGEDGSHWTGNTVADTDGLSAQTLDEIRTVIRERFAITHPDIEVCENVVILNIVELDR